MANGTHFHDGTGWKPTHSRPPLRRPVAVQRMGPVYIATDYGISADADDNTPALQALIDKVSAAGGGVIWVPVGTYSLRRADTEYAVWLKSNVSIVGESLLNTVFRQVDEVPYAAFQCRERADAPLIGCAYANFTIDAYGTGSVNQVWGKGFRGKYLRDCVFRDLRILGTAATGLGIDFLDRVVIDHVDCIDCGRTFTGAEAGSSGIGIGTGGWEQENFVVSNCVTVGCGQFGIFVENQSIFGYEGVAYSKGAVISGCITRGGLNHGIGIRGGMNVTVIGCESYENAANGVYLDGKCRNIHIQCVGAEDNGGHGIRLNPDAESVGITVRGCSAADNTGNGIRVSAASEALCIQGNNTRGNAAGLSIKEGLTLHDCAILGNAFLDGAENGAAFSGNTAFIDVDFAAAPTSIVLTAADLTVGVKVNPDGSEGTTGGGQASGYLDVSGMGSSIRITTTGTMDNIRVAQYDADKVSLVTDAALQPDNPLTVELLAGCVYIRIYYSSVSGAAASIDKVTIE